LEIDLKNARIMPNLKVMPNSNFQCQAHFKNAKFVKSGIEKCQLAALRMDESSAWISLPELSRARSLHAEEEREADEVTKIHPQSPGMERCNLLGNPCRERGSSASRGV